MKMRYIDNKAVDIKIAYIGGGSRGWAWGLMSDLVSCEEMSGDVYLYDIDFEAAKANEIIGNRFNYNCFHYSILNVIIYLNLLLYVLCGRGKSSFFYMWISSFLCAIY